MSNKETGGPAFPLALCWIETDMNTGSQKSVDVRDVSHGMSLRDYFAAKAIQGFCADSSTSGRDGWEIAEEAYQVADAMLAARSK